MPSTPRVTSRECRRPEFNRDVLLGLDRSLVQQSGRVTPLANGFGSRRKKKGGAAQELYLLHLAELPNCGSDPYGFRQSTAPRTWITRPTEGNQLAGFQSSGFRSHSWPGLRRNENRKLRGHCERRCGRDRFIWETHPERLVSTVRDRHQDCGRSCHVRRSAFGARCRGYRRG